MVLPLLRKAGWDPESIEGIHIVHEELTGVSGRVDIALKSGKRILACIELKDPAVPIDDFAKRQAAKYAASYYYVSEGVLDPVLAICTNGIEVFIMDPDSVH